MDLEQCSVLMVHIYMFLLLVQYMLIIVLIYSLINIFTCMLPTLLVCCLRDRFCFINLSFAQYPYRNINGGVYTPYRVEAFLLCLDPPMLYICPVLAREPISDS